MKRPLAVLIAALAMAPSARAVSDETLSLRAEQSEARQAASRTYEYCLAFGDILNRDYMEKLPCKSWGGNGDPDARFLIPVLGTEEPNLVWYLKHVLSRVRSKQQALSQGYPVPDYILIKESLLQIEGVQAVLGEYRQEGVVVQIVPGPASGD